MSIKSNKILQYIRVDIITYVCIHKLLEIFSDTLKNIYECHSRIILKKLKKILFLTGIMVKFSFEIIYNEGYINVGKEQQNTMVYSCRHYYMCMHPRNACKS